MFITNPTEEQLKEWYGCNKRVADYLIKEDVPFIHRKNKRYYFKKTFSLYVAIDNAPLWIKIVAPKP